MQVISSRPRHRRQVAQFQVSRLLRRPRVREASIGVLDLDFRHLRESGVQGNPLSKTTECRVPLASGDLKGAENNVRRMVGSESKPDADHDQRERDALYGRIRRVSVELDLDGVIYLL